MGYTTRLIFAAAAALVLGMSVTNAQPTREQTLAQARQAGAWFLQNPAPTTLRGALVLHRRTLRSDHPGYSFMASAEMCITMASLGFPCDLATRTVLSQFLTHHGKGLFPAAGGTNPFVSRVHDPRVSPLDDVYLGGDAQNDILLRAIERNRALFRDGDLTAAAVREHWRN